MALRHHREGDREDIFGHPRHGHHPEARHRHRGPHGDHGGMDPEGRLHHRPAGLLRQRYRAYLQRQPHAALAAHVLRSHAHVPRDALPDRGGVLREGRRELACREPCGGFRPVLFCAIAHGRHGQALPAPDGLLRSTGGGTVRPLQQRGRLHHHRLVRHEGRRARRVARRRHAQHVVHPVQRRRLCGRRNVQYRHDPI